MARSSTSTRQTGIDVAGGLDEADGLESSNELLVTDSFLLADGGVRGLELHRTRFLDSVATMSLIEEQTAAAFWSAAVARLPRDGDWFPRLDAVRTGQGDRLVLRVRPAPPVGASVRVASLSGLDPRRVPSVKGPDLVALLELRSAAGEDGIDEPVIVSPAGHIVDGVTCAVLWWRGERLMAPSASLARVDSVTAKSLRVLASATGTRTGEEFASPADLGDCEVWVVNSLHGIRVVTSWAGAPPLARRPGRAALWQRRLDALMRPLD